VNRRISGASKRNQNGNKSSQLVWMYPPRRNPPTGPKKIKEKKDPPKRNASLPKTSDLSLSDPNIHRIPKKNSRLLSRKSPQWANPPLREKENTQSKTKMFPTQRL
jgi:hypothetical protein